MSKQYIITLGGEKQVWDEAKYLRNKDALASKYPDAKARELTAFGENEQVNSGNSYLVTLGDEVQEWDGEKLNRNLGHLRQKYPEAQIHSIASDAPQQSVQPFQPTEFGRTTRVGDQVFKEGRDQSYLMEDGVSVNTAQQLRQQNEQEQFDAYAEGLPADEAEYIRAMREAGKGMQEIEEWKAKRKAGAKRGDVRKGLRAAEDKVESAYETLNNNLHYRKQIKDATEGIAAFQQQIGEQLQQVNEQYPVIAKEYDPEALTGAVQRTRGAEGDAKERRLMAANHFAEQAREAMSAPFRYDDSRGLASMGKGVVEYLNDEATWRKLANVEYAQEIRKTLMKIEEASGRADGIAQKIENGDLSGVITPEEETMLMAWLQMADAQTIRAYDTSRAYKAAEGAAVSAEFMLQMALTGGLGKAVSAPVTKGVGKWLLKGVQNIGAKSVAGKAAQYAARKGARFVAGQSGNILGSAARTPFFWSTYGSIADRGTAVDDNGNVVSMGQAIAEGGLDTLTETITEGMGRATTEAIGSVLNIAGAGQIVKAISKTAPGKWTKETYKALSRSKFGQVAKATGYDGFAEEMLEEMDAAVFDYVRGNPDALRDYFKVDNLLTTTMSFAPFTIFGGAVSGGQRLALERNLVKATDTFSKTLANAGYSKEQIAYFLDATRDTTPQQMSQTLSSLVVDTQGKFGGASNAVVDGPQMFEAVKNYATAVMNYQAVNGVYEAQGEQQREAKRQEIESLYGQFWRVPTAVNQQTGETMEASPVVEIAQLNDGRQVFVTSSPAESGEMTAIDETGNQIFITESDIADMQMPDGSVTKATETQNLDSYLSYEIMKNKEGAQQERMTQQRNEQKAEMSAQLEVGSVVNVGTEEAPENALIYSMSPDGEMFILQMEDGSYREMSIDELAEINGTPIRIDTDEDIDSAEADAIEARQDSAKTLRQLQNRYGQFWREEILDTDLGELTESVVDMAVVDASGTRYLIVDSTEDGYLLATPQGETFVEKGAVLAVNTMPLNDYLDLTTIQEGGLQLASEEDVDEGEIPIILADEEVAQEESVHIPTNEDGSVNQAAFWNNDPAGWAKWNDEQRQDGGVNSQAFIAKNLAAAETELQAMQEQYNAELNPDKMAAMEPAIQEKAARVAELQNLMQAYIPESGPIAQTTGAIQEQAEEPEQAQQETSTTEPERTYESVLTDLFELGLSNEEVIENINANLEQARAAVEKQKKKAPKMQADAAAYVKAKQEYNNKLDELQSELDFWEDARSRLPETPSQINMEKNPEPQNGLELAAYELGLREGGIKLQRESFLHHTGYGNSEARKFMGLFKSKQDGGMTIEQAGERLMEIDREYNTGFFDQSDPNAGMTAILEVLGANKTIGELRSYVARQRQEEAQRDADAAYSAMMAGFEELRYTLQSEAEFDRRRYEDVMHAPEDLTERDAELYIKYDNFAREKDDYESRTEEVHRPGYRETTEDVLGGTQSARGQSDSVLQSSQTVHSGGEADLNRETQHSGDNIEVLPQDGNPQIRTGEQAEEQPVENSLSEEQQAAIDLVSTPEMKLRGRIRYWENKLGVKVNVMTSANEVANQKALAAILSGINVWGWYEPATGEVAIYLPDFMSLPTDAALSEIDKTYVHEVVAHKGIKELLGEKEFNKLLDRVWESMSERDQKKYLSYPGVNGNTRAAADEYIAHLAESVELSEQERTIWDKIIDFINRYLHNPVTNDVLASLVRQSYTRLSKNTAAINANANQQAEGNTVFRAANGSLVGLHNISEDKLRKVLKQGGLANPSTAVVNISEYLLDGYGEISLIMPSSLVDANTGDNVGTYTGDAWTPTYPPISRKVDDRGWKIIKDRIRAAIGEESELYSDIVHGVDNYLDDNRSSKMEFVFLKEKGIEPEIAYKGADGFVGMRNLEAILGVQGLRDGWESYERYKNASPMAKRSFNMWLDAAGNKQAHRELKEQLKKEPKLADVLKLNEDVSFADFDSFTHDIFRKEQDAGKIDTYDTMSAAARYVDANNLRGEFEAWLESLMEQAGAKEVFFAGYTRSGERIYKDNTLENVSRHMRLQGRTNVYDDHGLSATKSVLLQRLTSLSQIRKNKGRLQNEATYNKEYDALKDRLWSIISQLADMQEISSNQFMNVDYAESRLQEAFTKRDPIAHLNKEFGYDIDPAGEYADEIKSFIKDVQQMPAKYFETKFERPVYLNEFAAAVMPTTTSEDIKQAVSEVGLPIFEYDPAVEGSRKEATLKATEGEGIRFRTAPSDRVLSLFNQARAGELGGKPISIGSLTKEGKEYLEQISGIKLKENVSFVLNPSDLNHIYNDHYGKNEKDTGNNIPLNDYDIRRLVDVIAFPTRVVFGEDKQGRKVFYFLSETPSGTYNLMEIYANKKGNLSAKTYYKTKKGATQRVMELESLLSTSETYSGATLSDAKIPILFDIANQGNDNTLFRTRITPEQDAAYMKAVEAGDMETAQRMVLEAAKLAMPNTKVVDDDGNPKVVYHGTPHQFTVFGKETKSKKKHTFKDTFFFNDSEAVAKGYGKLIPAFLNITNPIEVDFEGGSWRGEKTEIAVVYARTGAILKSGFGSTEEAESWKEAFLSENPVYAADARYVKVDDRAITGRGLSTDEYAKQAKEEGYDGCIFTNVTDAAEYELADTPVTDYVAFSPSQIKSADPVTYDDEGKVIPLSERFNPENDDIRFRAGNENQAIFVSNAAKAVEGIKQEKATPEQWLKMIEKNGGLKAGEDKWMGLSDWLKDSDKKTLTKQEVLDFINENMIVIEEVHYAADAEDDAENTYAMIERILQEKFGNYIAEYYEQNNGEDDNLYGGDSYEYAMDKLREEMNDEFPYTIERSNSVVYLTFPYEETDDLQEWADKLGIKFAPQNPINSTRLDYTTDGLTNKHEIALTVPTIESWNETDDIHFGDAGDGRAVAWIRFGETWEQRPSPQISRKVLVIDEIQSKRHQEGRERGYKDTRALWEDYNQRREELIAYVKQLVEQSGIEEYKVMSDAIGIRRQNSPASEKAYIKRMNERWGAEVTQKFISLTRAEDAAREAIFGSSNGVPDAPFDKNWHELAMKRMLRYAAENGYDVIAWTKGEQQAERYNLGKFYSGIERQDNPAMEGRRFVLYGGNMDSFMVNDEGIVIESTINEAINRPLSDIVGKELAVKMMQMDDNDTLDDADITIGGEGMKGFYDKILPAFMNKYGKKWGVKVEDIDLPSLENGLTMHSIPVTEEMKASVMEGQVMFRTTSISKEVQQEMDTISATAIVRGDYLKAPNGQPTNLTEEQWAMVRTKNFKEWFGDWENDPENASKVVDENGEPKVVYHGTNDEFTIFDISKFGKTDDGFLGIGHYFASGERYAKKYGANIMPCFVSIKNPIIANSETEILSFLVGSQSVSDAENRLRGLIAKGYVDEENAEVIMSQVSQELIDYANEHDGVIEERLKNSPWAELMARNPSQIKSATDNIGEFSEDNNDIRFRVTAEQDKAYMDGDESELRFRVVSDQETLDRLNSEPTIKVYRAMQLIDGKLYPPMSAKVDGELRQPIELGQWEEAEERPDLVDEKGRFKLDKGNKTSLKARYNPYFHTSPTPLNDQFSSAQTRPELVTVEVEVPESELTSGYKAEKAKDSVGKMEWKAGVVQSKLSGTRTVILSRWDKPVRIVPDSEVADVIVKMFDGKDIVMPSNVVTPSLRAELEKRGVPFVETDNQGNPVEEVLFRTTGTPMDPIDKIVEDGQMQVAETGSRLSKRLADRMAEINGNLSVIRKAAAAQRKYDEGTVKAITDLAQELMTKGVLSKATHGEIKRLLSIVKNATGKRNLGPAVDALMDIVISNQLRHARENMEELVKIQGSKVNASGVEVRGKLDVEGQRTVQAFKGAVMLSLDAINERIGAAESRLDSEDEVIKANARNELAGLYIARQYAETVTASIEEEEGLRNELTLATEDRLAGNMTQEAFKEFKKSVENAIRENRMERISAYNEISMKLSESLVKSIAHAKQLKQAEQDRIERIHHYANSDMEGMPSDEHGFKNDSWLNNGIIRFFMQPLATFDQMLKSFAPKSVNGEGYLWNYFMGGWQKATENEYLGYRDATAALDKKASEVFGKKMKWSDLFTEEGKMPTVSVKFWDGGKMKDHELSQGNLLYIYMVNKMSDGQMKLRKMGIEQEHVDAIVRQMDPRFIELADWIQDEFLPSMRSKYNAVHEKMFGAPMAAIDNYFPIKVLANARTREVDLGTDTENNNPSTITGSIIKRTKNSLALDIIGSDAFDVVLEHLQQMEHWAAFAEFNRDLNTLLSYKTFRNRVQNTKGIYGAGSVAWDNFRAVAEIAAGVYKPAVKRDSIDKIVLNIAKGVTGAKIAFRVYTAIKQLLSMPAFLSDASPVNLAKNMANPVAAWNWAMENLPMFEKRWKSREAGDSRLMKTDSDWKIWSNEIVETISRLGMTPNAFIDALTVSIGAKSIYETKLSQYLKDGMSAEMAEEKAKRYATVLFNESQQSNEGAFLSKMQLDRTGLAVGFSVYRNSSFGFGRMLVDAARNISKMTKRGYKQTSVEFMAKQMVREGMAEEAARTAAEKAYNRAAFTMAMRAVTFGFISTFAWSIGSSLPYLLAGDDDDEKKAMMEEALLRGLIGGLTEGFTGGNIVSDALYRVAAGKDFKNFNPSLLPIASDVEKLVRLIGNDKVAAVNEAFNLFVQSAVGVNPQTLTDAAVAIYDACNGDLETTSEVMLCISRILNVPQSQIEKLYIDELDFKAVGALEMRIPELAERYAKYKALRNAPVAYPLYSDEDEKKVIQKYSDRFIKTVEETKRVRGTDEEKAFYEYADNEYKEVDTRLKDLKRDLKKAYQDRDSIGVMEYAQKINGLLDTPEFQRYKKYKGKVEAHKKITKALRNSNTQNREKLEDLILKIRREMYEETRDEQ